jgi:hypothetical protein
MLVNEMQVANVVGLELQEVVKIMNEKSLTMDAIKAMDDNTLKALFGVTDTNATGNDANNNSNGVKQSPIERMNGSIRYNDASAFKADIQNLSQTHEILTFRALLKDGITIQMEITGFHVAALRKKNPDTGLPYTLTGFTGLITDPTTNQPLDERGEVGSIPRRHTCTTLVDSPFYEAVVSKGYDKPGSKWMAKVSVEKRENASGDTVTYNTYELL